MRALVGDLLGCSWANAELAIHASRTSMHIGARCITDDLLFKLRSARESVAGGYNRSVITRCRGVCQVRGRNLEAHSVGALFCCSSARWRSVQKRNVALDQNA